MIPVVYIHFGECDYATPILQQAAAKGNDVLFLNPPKEYVRQHPFARHYTHMSTNHHEFELACIVRWFMLRDTMDAQVLADCLYCDTDVMLFTNVENEWHGDPYYYEHDFTLSLGTSGHTSFWKFAALNAFCEFLMRTYRDRDEEYQECARIFAAMQAQGLSGGVSDMLLLKMFAAQSSLKVGEMSVVRNGGYWDHNLNSADGFSCWMNHKALLFIDGTPTAYHLDSHARVEFKSLHFQGGAKKYIAPYPEVAERLML